MDQQKVLDFWFGAPGSPYHLRPREVWFNSTPRFDYETHEALGPLQSAAASGGLNWWAEEPDGALALVILLDQVPRNIFRATPEAYATDPMARAISASAYAQGFDRVRPPVCRWFFYMPFMHSEALIDQQRSISLFAQLRDDLDSQQSILSAHRHHEIIARFGRFPHRNAILGRASTPEELAFLQEPGSGF